MRGLLIICGLFFCFSCSNKKQDEKHLTKSSHTKNERDSKTETNSELKEVSKTETVTYQVSTYDNPEFTENIKDHRERLKKLSEQDFFAKIASKVIPTLVKKHQTYFKQKSNYELLFAAKGAIFQEHKNDCVFIVYDKNNVRISILIYNENTNKYFELYQDLPVENGLDNADCNYSVFGTLDYQLADEIVYLEDYLIKKPESFSENTLCKITNISKDDDFILDKGCYSKKVSKNKLPNSMCIATSLVYNNWECLKYDKASHSFLIFYGQGFAD